MLNWRTLSFALLFGLLDAIGLPIVKAVSNGWNIRWMIVPLILYALSPFIFLLGLRGETLTILNLAWDLTSDVVVTFIGLVFFAEKISSVKKIGVALSFLSLLLMTYEGDGWHEFIDGHFDTLQRALNF
jgi:multidrug transporter EmrE-like cation transporter